MQPYHSGQASKQVRRSIRSRRTVFAPIGPTAAAVLASVPADTEVVYMVGPRPADWLAWATDCGDGWEAGRHYTRNTSAPVFRYTRGVLGRIELHVARSWFGEESGYSVYDATAAYDLLAAAVGRAFRGATLLATPGSTGRELFQRSIPAVREFPVLDDDTQNLIRATAGQGRTELLEPPSRFTGRSAKMGQLIEYDGRFMYAALCWGMPTGIPRRVTGVQDHDAYTPARHRITTTVPHDWQPRFGLVGVQDGERGGWRYPHRQRERFDTWCSGAELLVLRRCGWPVNVRESLVWERRTQKGPLDTWATKLVRLRSDVVLNAPNDVVARLCRGAVRALLLHSIGAFHGAPFYETRTLPIARAAEVPMHARPNVEGDHLVWYEQRRHAWASMAHPEWSATIWGRARARLLWAPAGQGALQRTGGDVVAFRTDALYLTRPQHWVDDGTVGRFRPKRRGHCPFPWPTTSAELLALRDSLPFTEGDL